MRKSLKQIFSMFACAAISLSAFTACSDSEVELKDFIPSGEVKLDFKGKEFKIVGLYREGIAEVAPVAYENMYSDMLIEHYNAISDKFNIKIITEGSDSISDDMQIKASTGDKFADIIDEGLYTLLDLYNADYIMEVSNIIDYSDLHSGKYGTESQIEGSTLRRKNGDEVFGFQAAYWGIPTPKFSNAGYFNPDMVKKFNLEDPYELIENGDWTWDVFAKMCINCASDGTDPSSDTDDTYGVAENPSHGYVTRAALASNNVEIVSYNEDSGLYEYNLDTPEFASTIEWVRDLYNKGGLKIIEGETGNSSIGNVVNNFIEGRSFFMVEHTYHGSTDRESLAYKADFNFSWIPFPKGPDAVDYAYGASVSGADRYFAFPAVGVDEDMLMSVVPSLFSQFDGLTEFEWRDYYSIGMFFDEKSEYWFYHMYDNLTNNYDYTLSFFSDDARLAKVLSGEKTLAQSLDEYLTVGQSEIDEYLNVQ